MSPDEVVEKLNKVSLADIKSLAEDMLTPDKFSMATIGPWSDSGLMDRVLRK